MKKSIVNITRTDLSIVRVTSKGEIYNTWVDFDFTDRDSFIWSGEKFKLAQQDSTDMYFKHPKWGTFIISKEVWKSIQEQYDSHSNNQTKDSIVQR